MARITITKAVSTVLQKSQHSDAVTGNTGSTVSINVPRGVAGVLSTRTSNTVGILTAANGNHNINTGEKFDLYWNGGYRVSVVAGTVSGVTIPFSLGDAGDNLPVLSSPVVISKQVPFSIALEMDELLVLAFGLKYPATIVSVPHGASARFDHVGQNLHSYLILTPNFGIVSDMTNSDFTDATGLLQARYSTGFVSNPSIKANAVFKVLALTQSGS